jgi:hypothetical protein
VERTNDLLARLRSNNMSSSYIGTSDADTFASLVALVKDLSDSDALLLLRSLSLKFTKAP